MRARTLPWGLFVAGVCVACTARSGSAPVPSTPAPAASSPATAAADDPPDVIGDELPKDAVTNVGLVVNGAAAASSAATTAPSASSSTLGLPEGTSPEHVAPDFGGGDFGIHLVEPDGGTRSPFIPRFVLPLRIPRVLAPTFQGERADFYDIHTVVAQAQIVPGQTTTVYAYGGDFPGPTIEAHVNHPVVVRFHNDLPEVISTHLHGSRTPPASDGAPQNVIPPGSFRDYFYPNPADKPACTMWYHDHAMDVTAPHVYKGLAGFYLLDDPLGVEEPPLPDGAFDVPLVVQDRIFTRNNQLLYPPFAHNGFYGDVMVTNGVAYPFFKVQNRKYRFRILNGCNARTLQLALSDGSPLIYIGTGAGFAPRSLPIRSVQVAAADRAEVVIDFSRYPLGSSVKLVNLAGRLPGSIDVLRFDVATQATSDSPPVPATLRPLSDFDDAPITSSLVQRTFVFERRHGLWTINGKIFEPSRIDAAPHLDAPEVWTLVNKSGGWVHPVHTHLGEFLILDRNGIPPESTDIGFHDVVLLHENETVRILIEWKDYTGRYVSHCHNLEHEDMRMMINMQLLGTDTLPTFVAPGTFPFAVFPPPEGPTPRPTAAAARKP